MVLWTFATHGLIAVLLVVFYVISIRPGEASMSANSAQRTLSVANQTKAIMAALTFLGIFVVSVEILYVLFNRKQPFVDHHATVMQAALDPSPLS